MGPDRPQGDAMNRKYELVYVLKPDATEQDVAEMQQQVEGIIGRIGGALE